MKTGLALCKDGPLDGQTVVIEGCFWFELRFNKGLGHDKFKTYVYGLDIPKGMDPLDERIDANNWHTFPWTATLVKEPEEGWPNS